MCRLIINNLLIVQLSMSFYMELQTAMQSWSQTPCVCIFWPINLMTILIQWQISKLHMKSQLMLKIGTGLETR